MTGLQRKGPNDDYNEEKIENNSVLVTIGVVEVAVCSTIR